MEIEIQQLKRQIKALKLLILLFSLGAVALVVISRSSRNEQVLRAKGLIIEDGDGNPFILMGSPIPNESFRRRKDSIHGIVFLDQRGIDRLFIGEDGRFQMGGQLVGRSGNGWSYLVNDPSGDERGGFGFSDEEDRIGLGLDYGGKDGLEAIYLNASNDVAYLAINGNVKNGARDRIILWHDVGQDLSMVKLGDKAKDDMIVLRTKSGHSNIFSRDSAQNKIEIITPPKNPPN